MADSPSGKNYRRYSSRAPQQHSKKRRRMPPLAPPKPPKPACSVCSDANKPPTYKCPKCLALYCSVVCCKEHKVICSGTPPSEPQVLTFRPMAPLRRQQAPQDDEDLDEGWKITDDMKKTVENSSWLRQQLQDGGLRDLMQKIVASGDGLQQQRYPQFQVFVDKLLVLAGILEREDGENEPLEEWLEQDWSHDPPPLSLRPLRRKLPVFQPVDISSTEEESSEDTGQSGEEEDEEGEENEKSSVENEEEDDEDDDNSHGNNN